MPAPRPETGDAWGTVGRAYDDMSFSVSDALTHATQRLSPRPGQRVLDVATGTGWSARNAARFGAHVVGVDPSEGLLEAARELAGQVDPPVEFEIGNAESLPFEDASFDALISTFGHMFAPDHGAAAGELARVLKPGGRMVLATWVPSEAVDETFAMLARYESRYRPPATGGSSPMEWGDPEHVARLLSDRFELVFERGVNHVFFDSAEHMWEFYLRSFGPLRELHDLVNEPERQAMRREFVDLHARYAVPAGIAVARPYLISVGTRRA